MKCAFCTRQAVHVFDNAPPLCESCGKAYREGFEHGRVFESTRKRVGRARSSKTRHKPLTIDLGPSDVYQTEEGPEVRQTRRKPLL